MINVAEAATRKLGPLPTWAWAGVVGVGALAVRSLRGGGSTARNSTSGTVATIGGSYDALGGGGASPGDGGGNGGGTPTTTVGGDTLPGVIGQFSSAFTLQQQLNDALTKLAGLLGARSTLQTNIANTKTAINTNLDAYRAGKISKATYTTRLNTYNANLSKYNTQLAATNTQISDANTLIADLKARLAAIFAAPAATAA